MKNFLKILLLALLLSFILFSLFICEESIRLKHIDNSAPLIVLDKTKCSKNDRSCYDSKNEYEEDYWSAGYTLKTQYVIDEKSSEDNLIIRVNKKEFRLFNKILLWAWVE